MSYEIFKFLHVLGVILLIGNVTVTAFWKVFADRTNDARLVAHAQHGVTVSDWLFTAAGIALLIIGGYGMALVAGMDVFGSSWLIWGQILFAVSGLIWAAILIPTQIRQARQARAFDLNQPIPSQYKRDSRTWIVWGLIATVPLVAAVAIMIAKP
ncbi:MAG: DUF2269 domain-containing protein [Chitinophagales bacterium]|nr:DUF2269 domain-containing protein [Hyphomicrobiales bacterium]